MIRLLKCEWKKTRRRYVLLCALFITAIGLIFSLYGDYSSPSGAFLLENGWMMLLYQLPLVNAIFFPLLSIVVASRLADIEHKGATLKQLCAIEEKGKLYDAKLIYGLGILCISLLTYWLTILIFGKIMNFGGTLPLMLYILYLLFTLVSTFVVYLFQHFMSMTFKNQAVAFFAGVIGTFIGVFSMFLPQLPWLRRAVPWGYYGALQFVGLFGWTSETRYENAYFELMEIDWLFFLMILGILFVFYFIGRMIFCKKEV